ncbi:MAG: hypothetical protein AAFV53_08265 [Myxococcota bacterium]
MHRSGVLGHYIEQGFWRSMTAAEQAVVAWLQQHPGETLPDELDEPAILGDLVAQGILLDDGERYTIAMEGLQVWLRRFLRRRRVSA